MINYTRVIEMKLAEALKTVSKRNKITYKGWAEKIGLTSIGSIAVPMSRGDMRVSTLVKLVNALGYDVMIVKRHALEPEEPIVIDPKEESAND